MGKKMDNEVEIELTGIAVLRPGSESREGVSRWDNSECNGPCIWQHSPIAWDARRQTNSDDRLSLWVLARSGAFMGLPLTFRLYTAKRVEVQKSRN